MALPTGPGWPDVDEYKQWARVPDTIDDAAVDQALSAVQEAVIARCPILTLDPCPHDAYYAVLLWTNRVLNRRNSPDGIVGVADLGVATIKNFDKDIAQMLSPYVEPAIA
jgi:hypothetical protein